MAARQDAQPPASAPAGRRPRWVLLVVFLIALGAGAPFGWRFYQDFATTQRTDNATLQGDVIQISSKVAGTVAELDVADNQRVEAGQLLVRLDPTDYEISVAQAQAALELTERQSGTAQTGIGLSAAQSGAQTTQAQGTTSLASAGLAIAEAGVATAEDNVAASQAKLAQAQAQFEQAVRDLERMRALAQEGVIPVQKLDQAETAYKVTQAAVESAKQDVAVNQSKLEQAKLGVKSAQAQLTQSQGVAQSAQASAQQTAVQQKQYEAALAQVGVAQAALKAAQQQLSYTTISAPAAGRVGKRSVELGQRVTPGQPLLALVRDGLWVVANFKETQLNGVKPGAPVEVRIDSLPGQVFAAHVDSLSPASGAIFSLLPPENASGNFTKIVQRVPVKIVFEEGALSGYEEQLVPGLSVIVKVKVR